MHDGQSGLDLTRGEGGSREESSGDEAGGGDEEREEGPVHNAYVSEHSQSYILPRKPKYPKIFY